MLNIGEMNMKSCSISNFKYGLSLYYDMSFTDHLLIFSQPYFRFQSNMLVILSIKLLCRI